MQEEYSPKEIEAAVRQRWADCDSFTVRDDDPRPKYFSMCMWPYPSGDLHVGHLRNYALGDVWARYQRMRGHNVLQAMGWDAFGKDAELKARRENIHPIDWVRANTTNMRRELSELGFMIDWNRELAAYNPLYYRWEQYLFVRMWEQGLLYYEPTKVLWDKSTETVTSRRDIEDGKVAKEDVGLVVMPAYLMRMRKYANELLEGLETLQWPEKIVKDQRYLIGRSDGMSLKFPLRKPVAGLTELEVYTTRPDTVFGVTYMAVHSAHPLALHAAQGNTGIAVFCTACANILPMDAGNPQTEKKGMPLDIQVTNPANGEEIPVWVADYVVDDYGSGALMGVPGHDHRDFNFATKYALPILRVIAAPGMPADTPLPQADVELGVAVNSGPLNGLDKAGSIAKLEEMLGAKGLAWRDSGLSLRDWPINRRMYWGTPIPIIICPSCDRVPVPIEDLPVTLPLDLEFGKDSLAEHPSFTNCTCPKCGAAAQRETDTMDTFVNSSWYHARYTCRDSADRMLDDRASQWLPVDHYFGGDEHAQGHLVYCRFIHKVMRDLGLHPQPCGDEPYQALLCQGMVLGSDRKKMSKSQENTVLAKDILDTLGADTARMYIVGIGNPKDAFPWNDEHVHGHAQFLSGLWRLARERRPAIMAGKELELTGTNKVALHRLLHNVDRNLREQHFNNLVFGGIHSVRNLLWENPADHALQHQGFLHLLKVMNLVSPHIAEAMWSELGFPGLLIDASWWPKINVADLDGDTEKYVVQINGKRRDELEATAGCTDGELLQQARGLPNVVRNLAGKAERQARVVRRSGGHGIIFFVIGAEGHKS